MPSMLHGIYGCNDEWMSNVLIRQWVDVTFTHRSLLLEENIYRPPAKLWDGNVFRRVCLSVCPQTGPHVITAWTRSNFFTWGSPPTTGPEPTPLTK